MAKNELPDLPYEYDALEPYIDEQTMKLHHDKHHAGYVKKLNDAIEGTDFEDMDVDDILADIENVPEEIRTKVRNNGGGHSNHRLFWTIMGPDGGGEPEGELAEAINDKFGSFEEFKEQFENTATGQFGSGWAWLCIDKDGELHIESTPNQDSPVMDGHTPILGLDVWEHAYYLKYQNKRAEYAENWWNLVNWEEVARRFDENSG